MAALEDGVKGSKWFSLIDKVARADTLHLAWTKVVRNRGAAAGVDGQSVEKFAARAQTYLNELEQALRQGSYRPEAVKRVEIPKGPGQTRPLGIPAVKDRIVQTALKLVIEPIFERDFHDSSYGFRPGRSCHDALREVARLIGEGHTHVVDADLKGYFDSIPACTAAGMRVGERISDGRILDLIEAYFWAKKTSSTAWNAGCRDRGTPQGAVISPLLANLYLHPLDGLMQDQGYRMVRYADDFVGPMPDGGTGTSGAGRSADPGRRGTASTLHPDKTHVGD